MEDLLICRLHGLALKPRVGGRPGVATVDAIEGYNGAVRFSWMKMPSGSRSAVSATGSSVTVFAAPWSRIGTRAALSSFTTSSKIPRTTSCTVTAPGIEFVQ